MSLSKTRAEQAKAVHGAWVGPKAHGFEGVHFKVRGRFNADFRALNAKLVAAVPRENKIRTEMGFEITPSDNDRILSECLLETVLLDWKGLKETDDSPEIPFSKDKARELLSDPLLSPLRDSILTASLMVAQDGKEDLEQDVKN